MIESLQQALNSGVYQAYSYSYPHKTAYRRFDQAIDLKPLWANEKTDAVFLYVHIPYCEMRCGFCNLFTLVRPGSEQPDLYLDTLERQMHSMTDILEDSTFARVAIGGGTPTYLSVRQLERLLSITERNLISLNTVPSAIEVSPETINADKLILLQERGVNRISMGVQSFVEQEVKQLARRQDNIQVQKAIELLKQHTTADINLDLIYGIAGQTKQSWLYSLKQALSYKPEELYLYPLYVREKTGLDKIQSKQLIQTDQNDDDQLALYELGRDYLLANGYHQLSMRMFRLNAANHKSAPVYRCQEDGMIGLGAGARSYTRTVHYSSEYAVGRKGVSDVIKHYIERPTETFYQADYGTRLNHDEQRRRYLIQSLLNCEGLSLTDYQMRFGKSSHEDFPQLKALIELELAEQNNSQLQLTPNGLARADTIGPWLGSFEVKTRMQDYSVR